MERSVSSRSATTIAPALSVETSVPMYPPASAFCRMRSMRPPSSRSGVMSPPMTSSALNPSSVTPSTRVFGVQSEVTVRRSMPGRNITDCVTS